MQFKDGNAVKGGSMMEHFGTKDLINELKKRDSIEILPLGLYQGYQLKGKYGNPDITSGTVILIRDDPCNTPDSFV